MLKLRYPGGNAFVAGPIALDSQALIVLASATEAEVGAKLILNRKLAHEWRPRTRLMDVAIP